VIILVKKNHLPNMSPPRSKLPQKNTRQENDSFLIYESLINKLSPNQKEFDDMILSTDNFA
jgi:hypothetical protein